MLNEEIDILCYSGEYFINRDIVKLVLGSSYKDDEMGIVGLKTRESLERCRYKKHYGQRSLLGMKSRLLP